MQTIRDITEKYKETKHLVIIRIYSMKGDFIYFMGIPEYVPEVLKDKTCVSLDTDLSKNDNPESFPNEYVINYSISIPRITNDEFEELLEDKHSLIF